MTGRAVILLSLAAFASAASLRATDPLLALISNEYGVTPGSASLVITAFALSYGLFQVFHGPIGDRYGKFRMVMLTTAISGLTSLLCAAAPGLSTLVAARFVSGITIGALIPLSMAWIGDVVAYERRQATIARFLIGQMLGVAFGAAAAGVLGAWFGWRAIFVVLGLLFFAIALLLRVELGRDASLARGGSLEASLFAAFGRMLGLLRRSWVRVILTTVAIEGALANGAFAFIAWDLHQRHGVSLGASGAFIAAFPAGGLLYAAVAGRVVPALGERGLVLAGGGFLGAAYLGMTLAPGAGFVLPCIFFAGVGIYMMHNTLQVHATQMAPEARGAAVSLFALCLFTGQSIGIWCGARVIDAWGIIPVFAAAGLGLPLVALDFRRRLARRSASLRSAVQS
ncbi:MAG: MFS transporter [Betaproteobacteria bacterium]|jgi:YNFM family putative membrane transporter|nr:MFS transporter [Betaproteobacteria bacterium]